MALAGRDQVERLALRAERPQRPAGQGAADIVGEHRPGAHRVDARLRQVARRERRWCRRPRTRRRGRRRASVSSTVRKPRGVERQSGLGQPARRRGLRGPQDLVGLDRRVAVEHEPPGLDARDRRAGSRPRCRARRGWRRKRARNAAGKLGRISATSETSTNDSPPASKPARATSRRSRRSTESSSSTPPAPAPTSARRVRPGARARAPGAPRTGAGSRRSA